MRILLVALIGSFIPICFADDHWEFFEELDLSIPSVGEETTVYLGDRMTVQKTGYYQSCLTAKKTLQTSAQTWQ
jgi:hypothetical protein